MSTEAKSTKSDIKEQLIIFSRSMAVGGTAATIAKTIVSPICRTKILLQTQAKNPTIPENLRYTGISDVFVKLWKNQPENRKFYVKLLTYWRGNFTNVVRYFPQQAVNFACKSRFKEFFYRGTQGKQLSFASNLGRNLLAGGCAGVTGLTVIYPLDFARTRLQSDIGVKKQFNGITDCIVKTFKNEGGIRGIYRGYVMSVAGIFPYRAAYFGLYDTSKRYLMKKSVEETSFWYKWAISQTCTIFSSYCAYPFDTVRRLMQLEGPNSSKTSVQAFVEVYKSEGIQGFFHGALANAVRATGAALCLVFYDSIGRFLFCDKDYGK